MASIRELITRLAQSVDAPDPDRAEPLWAAYRADGPDAAAAFATLMAWYGVWIDRRVRGFVRSDMADDVFQEVLIRLHRHRHRLATFGHALRWARKVAVNLSLRALRTERRRVVRETARAVAVTAVNSTPTDDLHDAVRAAVARLPAKEREAVALVFFEGLARQAAAEAVGVHRDTLAKRVESALGRLKKSLAVAGGLAAVEGALAAPPARTDHLTALIVAAWERAEPAHGSWSPLLWWLGGLTVAVGLTVGGVVWWPRSEPPVAVAEPPPPRESLQAQNLRILKAEVLPKVLAELQKSLPPDNPVSVADVRAFGSEVEVEFRPARPVPFVFDSRVIVRYCVLTRTGRATTLDASGHWFDVNVSPTPSRVTLPLGLTLDRPQVRDNRALLRLFDALPPDDRAEEEQVKYWFGPGGWSGADFTVPSTAGYVFGNSRTLYVWFHWTRFTFARPASGGGWRFIGDLPAFFLTADETHFYHMGPGGVTLARRIDEPAAEWTQVGRGVKWPSEPRELAVAGGNLYGRGAGRQAWGRSVTDPKSPWKPLPDCPESDPGFAAGGGWLYCGGSRTVHALPFDQPGADWVRGTAASPEPRFLAVWGDRLLHIPSEPGPIRGRPLSTPDSHWGVVGRVHVPDR